MAEEYKLTKGAEIVRTSSPSTRDYLLTEGWTASTITQLPDAPDTPEAIEVRVATLEEEGLFGKELLVNPEFRAYSGTTTPDHFTSSWTGASSEYKDTSSTSKTPIGGPSWGSEVPSGAIYRYGTERFSVRDQDTITVRWRAMASSQGRYQVQLLTSDGYTDTTLIASDVTSQVSAYTTPVTGVDVFKWKDYSATFTVPRDHKMARVYIEASSATASMTWHNLASMSVRAANQPPVLLHPVWRVAVTNMTLTAGWGVYGSPWGDSVGFTKRNGVVYGRGLLTIGAGAALNQTIMTVPVGWRPISNLILPAVVNDAWAEVRVFPTGAIQVSSATSFANWFTLGGLTWPIDL
jgi:hypothetical protein